MVPPRPQRPTPEELLKSWAITTRHLTAAAEALGGPHRREYEEFMVHNELELALDQLEAFGEESHQPQQFWEHLLAAAENMGLTKHAARYRDIIQGMSC